MFGSKTTRGAFIVNLVLCGCAAYRTQLFLYLKACGREELSTMNLWAGVDAPAAGLDISTVSSRANEAIVRLALQDVVPPRSGGTTKLPKCEAEPEVFRAYFLAIGIVQR